MKCEKCGKALTAAEAKSGKYSYYVCHSLLKKGKGTCKTPRLNSKRFEKLMIDQIRANILTESNIRDLVRLMDSVDPVAHLHGLGRDAQHPAGPHVQVDDIVVLVVVAELPHEGVVTADVRFQEEVLKEVAVERVLGVHLVTLSQEDSELLLLILKRDQGAVLLIEVIGVQAPVDDLDCGGLTAPA